MSTFHTRFNNKDGMHEVWELLEHDFAALIATFSSQDDAEEFACMKTDREFAKAELDFKDLIPELGPDEFELVDDEDEYNEEEFYAELERSRSFDEDEEVLELTDDMVADQESLDEEFRSRWPVSFWKTTVIDGEWDGADDDMQYWPPNFWNVPDTYCEAGTPISNPLAPEHGDFL